MKMTTQNNKTINLYLLKQMITNLKRLAVPAVLILLLSGTTAVAQDRTITLEEAIKLGVDNSNVVKLSKAKIDEAITQYNQAKDGAYPNASASFGYDRAQIPVNKVDFGTQTLELPKSADAYLGTLSVNETIFGGNKLKYAKKSTDLLIQVARLEASNDRDGIAYEIIGQYYNLYKVLQSKKVVEQNLVVVDQQIKQAQRFFEQGLVTKNDVLRFQLQRSNIELNGIDLETNRKVVNYNLCILLGLPETTQLNIAEIKDAAMPVGLASSYVDTALANRAEVKAYDVRSQVAATNLKSVKANLLPTVAASGTAYYAGLRLNPIPENGYYLTPIVLGVNLSWKFSELWNNKNKVSQAKVQQQEIDYSKAIKLNDVRREVNQDYQNYVMALDKIKLLQTSIDQATENNKILDSKYKSNIASATDRADAQTLLYQAEINLELAKADAGLAYYTLLKSTGKLNK